MQRRNVTQFTVNHSSYINAQPTIKLNDHTMRTMPRFEVNVHNVLSVKGTSEHEQDVSKFHKIHLPTDQLLHS